MSTSKYPQCVCCNPLFNQFWMHLTRRKFLLGTGAFAAAVIAGSGGESAKAQTEGIRILSEDADAVNVLEPSATIYVAQKVITMEPDHSEATAVAVADGRIIALGSLDQVKGAISGGRSYQIDRTFENKIIMPGFVEHHVHPLLGVLTMALEVIAIEEWAVPGKFSAAVPDEATYRTRLQEALTRMAGSDPNETLFTWGYHHYFHGKIYRPQLDEISLNRPVIIWHRSCHEFILNTAALNKYGVTEADLQGKGLGSEQSSWEDGHFFEKGMEVILPFFAKDILAPERTQAGLRIFKSYLLSKGITTICEPATQMSRPIQEFWEESLNAEDAAFRTYFIPDGRALFDKHKGESENLVAVTRSYLDWGRGKVQWLPQQVKLLADGAIFSQLMQMKDPYLDGHQGEWIAVPEDYAAAFKLYWDAGYQIHTHVNGDAGLQVVVDTLQERMQANPRTDHRFTVVHFAVSTEEQVQALGQLGATITANPYYVTSLADRYSEFGLGSERADTMVRLGSVVKTPMPISLHSDMPMAPADPLFLAWCAATRQTVSGRVAAPEQQIDVARAISAITIESAYVIQKENELGSIKPGKTADFAILEQDPFAVPVDQLKNIAIWGVVYEGKKIEAPKGRAITSIPTATPSILEADLSEISRTKG
ncbi:MAG: amidohydrolase [Pegethrix bostrychoides GSE-TBD4-15B]|uniref:Amidohydrolase n=1 Tax=Pegethrix bostrychoides GSE-TBD4-15B TaxID=2839662 RepID=A0A951PE97_9CYAN|nr:amidohydrolase [Pegethrix bostrychoides GSE-TBD4-15B]